MSMSSALRSLLALSGVMRGNLYARDNNQRVFQEIQKYLILIVMCNLVLSLVLSCS
jgi:hypothetical protein